jgi:Spy/CpxP family protein refolding chaperone
MAALNLTPDQQQKMQAIREANRAKMQANPGMSDTERQALRTDAEKQIRVLLTPEQLKQFDAIRAQGGMRQGGGRTVANDPRFAGLNLTAAQQKQIQATSDELHEKMRQARTDTTLSPDEQRSRMQQLFQNEQQEIKAVLTPDQLKQYQARSQQWQQRGGGGGHFRPGGGAPGQAPPAQAPNPGPATW